MVGRQIVRWGMASVAVAALSLAATIQVGIAAESSITVDAQLESVDVILADLSLATQEATGSAIASVVVVTESAAGAEDRDPPVIALREFVDQALTYNPGLKALYMQSYAQQQLSESIAGYGGLSSNLSIMGIYTDSPLGVFAGRLNAGRITQQDFDPALLNDPDYYGSLEYKLQFMYPLFDSGRVKLLADAVLLNSNALDHDQLRAEHELAAQVIELYFNHALLTDQLVVLTDAHQTVTELHRMIVSFEREGLVTYSDIAAAEVELANIADQINRATSRIEMIEQVLGILTGSEPRAFISQVPSAADLDIRVLDDFNALSLDFRPDLSAMYLRVCAATNVLDEAIKRRNPTVGLFAETKHTTPELWNDGHTEATFGAQLMIDLDTGSVLRNEIEQKRAELAAAQLGLQQLQDMALIEVAQTFTEVQISEQAILTFQAQQENSAENLRVVRNRYSEGLTNYLDLRLAVTTHLESGLREVKSHHDFQLAYLSLLVASGLVNTEFDPYIYDDAEAIELQDDEPVQVGGYDE